MRLLVMDASCPPWMPTGRHGYANWSAWICQLVVMDMPTDRHGYQLVVMEMSTAHRYVRSADGRWRGARWRAPVHRPLCAGLAAVGRFAIKRSQSRDRNQDLIAISSCPPGCSQSLIAIRSSSGRHQPSSGRDQVVIRSSSGRDQVVIRSSSGRDQVVIRSSSGEGTMRICSSSSEAHQKLVEVDRT
jgi:hypothetical protein